MKDTEFLGSSLKVIKGFPGAAKARIGNEIQRLQRGADPTDFKSMKDLGSGYLKFVSAKTKAGIELFM
ncbi:MAG: hypothetical protein HQ498_05440 [Pseudohongiella sp.]|nr:hypothetical protein [Pseudohongiella sp.]